MGTGKAPSSNEDYVILDEPVDFLGGSSGYVKKDSFDDFERKNYKTYSEFIRDVDSGFGYSETDEW